jgi:hypothetical protein
MNKTQALLEFVLAILRQGAPKDRLEICETEEQARKHGVRLGDTVVVREPVKFYARPSR